MQYGIENESKARECYIEFKCPYAGRDVDAISAFLLHSIGIKVNDNGTYHLNKNHFITSLSSNSYGSHLIVCV